VKEQSIRSNSKSVRNRIKSQSSRRGPSRATTTRAYSFKSSS
jgi:hypothetical protein